MYRMHPAPGIRAAGTPARHTCETAFAALRPLGLKGQDGCVLRRTVPCPEGATPHPTTRGQPAVEGFWMLDSDPPVIGFHRVVWRLHPNGTLIPIAEDHPLDDPSLARAAQALGMILEPVDG